MNRYANIQNRIFFYSFENYVLNEQKSIFSPIFGIYQNLKRCYTKNYRLILIKFTEFVALPIFFIVLKFEYNRIKIGKMVLNIFLKLYVWNITKTRATVD